MQAESCSTYSFNTFFVLSQSSINVSNSLVIPSMANISKIQHGGQLIFGGPRPVHFEGMHIAIPETTHSVGMLMKGMRGPSAFGELELLQQKPCGFLIFTPKVRIDEMKLMDVFFPASTTHNFVFSNSCCVQKVPLGSLICVLNEKGTAMFGFTCLFPNNGSLDNMQFIRLSITANVYICKLVYSMLQSYAKNPSMNFEEFTGFSTLSFKADSPIHGIVQKVAHFIFWSMMHMC